MTGCKKTSSVRLVNFSVSSLVLKTKEGCSVASALWFVVQQLAGGDVMFM